jgi:hypothetical protein
MVKIQVMQLSEFRKVLIELKKLTPKEREYMINLLKNRTGNKAGDMRVLEFDIELYRFPNATRMKRLFELMYGLNDNEIAKLSRTFMR